MKKEEITESLANIEFCAITTDGGTSSDATSFQVLNNLLCNQWHPFTFPFQDTNVHFIDSEMELRSACLAVTENKEAHTADNYRDNVDEVLEDFKIKEKVVKTVTDNENKMRAAFDDELLDSGLGKLEPRLQSCRLPMVCEVRLRRGLGLRATRAVGHN